MIVQAHEQREPFAGSARTWRSRKYSFSNHFGPRDFDAPELGTKTTTFQRCSLSFHSSFFLSLYRVFIFPAFPLLQNWDT
mmetsp:Transcript_33679/g.46086  ORF Transcript_33679/g.46086 Transcript_33679/m.46086 type:complete len:80 (+) Transcript_33679:351-590(+)